MLARFAQVRSDNAKMLRALQKANKKECKSKKGHKSDSDSSNSNSEYDDRSYNQGVTGNVCSENNIKNVINEHKLNKMPSLRIKVVENNKKQAEHVVGHGLHSSTGAILCDRNNRNSFKKKIEYCWIAGWKRPVIFKREEKFSARV